MTDELLANGTTEFRQEERDHAVGRVSEQVICPNCRAVFLSDWDEKPREYSAVVVPEDGD